MTHEFTPAAAELVTVSSITDLTPEQVAAITGLFDPRVKPKVVATLESFNVVCDLSAYEAGANLQGPYIFADYRAWETRLYVYVWVKGSKTVYAPQSYNPTPPILPKSGLWRLTPDLTGAVADNTDTVTVTLPRTAPVVHIGVRLRGLLRV